MLKPYLPYPHICRIYRHNIINVPCAGKTHIFIQAVRLLIQNTCNRSMARPSPGSQRNSTAAASSNNEPSPRSFRASATIAGGVVQAPRELPEVGPILFVALTNHALDAGMQGLVKAGVTEGLLRVTTGAGCKVPELQQYCLDSITKAQVRILTHHSMVLDI